MIAFLYTDACPSLFEQTQDSADDPGDNKRRRPEYDDRPPEQQKTDRE